MPVNRANTGGPDRKRINVDHDSEVRDCAAKLAVTPEKLVEVVAAVGDRVLKVQRYLRGSVRKGSKRAR